MSDSLRPHGPQSTRILCPWGFSKQEYWSRLPCPPPGDLPEAGIEPRSSTLQSDSLLCEPPGNASIGVDEPIASPGALPDTGIKAGSSSLRADSLLAELPGKPL